MSTETTALLNYNKKIKEKISDLNKKEDKKDIEQKSKIKDIILLNEKLKSLRDKKT